MSHKYEMYLKEKTIREKPKKIPKKIESYIEEPEFVQSNVSKGNLALNRTKYKSDLIIYSEIIGKPKGFEY